MEITKNNKERLFELGINWLYGKISNQKFNKDTNRILYQNKIMINK
jgi:hypothetical protein